MTVTPRGSLVITGRSDATLNRGGVRLGTAEFYRVVEELPEVKDSLVVHLEDPAGGAGELVLFVSLAPGVAASEDLPRRIAGVLRSRLSPRHVPDTLQVVRALPRTLSGKKLEVPVKKILRGAPPEDVVAAGASRRTQPRGADASGVTGVTGVAQRGYSAFHFTLTAQ